MKRDPEQNISRFLTSNLTGAALVKEREEWLLSEKLPLADLRNIIRVSWPEHYGREVTLPPDVQSYLNGRDPGPLTPDEVQSMEQAIERHHGIVAPHYVAATPTLQASGRAWSYVPEATPYLSGFEFNSSDA